MSLHEVVLQRAVEAGGKLKVKSALNPILWLCAIITLPALFVVAFKSTAVWLIVLLYLPVVAAIFGFFFLLFFDRDKLQSEEYQLQKRSLELIEQKGDAEAIPAISVEAISNPALPPILPALESFQEADDKQ